MNNIKGYINKKKEGSGLYETLHLEALEIVQKLSSGIWTDYNEHDPGVTILESLVYAITELAHKTQAPIEDILIKSKGETLQSGDNGFFIASDILTTCPVSFSDYRKIWIDQIVNVKNVWVYPVDNYSRDVSNIKGLLHVFVEKYQYKTDADEDANDNERIIKELKEIYNSNRNLCEDIYDVEIYKPLRLTMSLNITLSSSVNGEEVLARIFNKVNDYLAPDVKYYSLWELQQKNIPVNTIFNGPKLFQGFILDEDLKNPLEEIVISDILKIITQIAGIVSVNDFFLQYKTSDSEKTVEIRDRFKVPKNTNVMVSFPKSNRHIIFQNSNTLFQPDLKETKKQLAFIRALNYGGFKEASDALNKITIPEGVYLDMVSYFPVRKQLPELYGIGDRGLGSEATELRRAQVKQLQAYLMPFDQVMLNFLTQLNNIYTLYDVKDNNQVSYFTKVLPDVEELQDLIKPAEKDFDLEIWKQVLDTINNTFDNEALVRYDHIANHLLARFNETFQTYALRKINSNSYGAILVNEDFEKKLLASKRELVREYGSISYGRARSFNYNESEVGQDIQLIPGILRKLAILMDIHDYKIKSLVQGVEDSEIKISPITLEVQVNIKAIYIPEENIETIEIEEVIVDETLEKDLSSAMHYMGDRETVFKDVLKNGVIASNYEIKKGTEKYQYYVLYKNSSQEYNIAFLAKSRHGASKEIQKAVETLVTLNQESEGFFMVEHLLLLPPYKAAHYGFQIDLSRLPVLESNLKLKHNHWMSCQERNDIIIGFIDQLSLGTLEYAIIHKNTGYSLEISLMVETMTEKNVLLVSENQYQSEDALKKEIEILKGIGAKVDIEELESIVCCHVNYGNGKPIINEDFFSFQSTFIAPSWPVRFQSENFRRMFENTIYEQFPIHIKYDIHWLNYENLKTFEIHYFKWLEQLPVDGEDEKLMDLAYELVVILQRLIEQQDNV